MKIRVMSDLHIEFFNFEPIEVPADVIVLAGDILPEHYGLVWARKAFPDRPIVYVMGNHEYDDAHDEHVLDRAREQAAKQRVHLLENDQAMIDGVRFLGTTLWGFRRRSAITLAAARVSIRERLDDRLQHRSLSRSDAPRRFPQP